MKPAVTRTQPQEVELKLYLTGDDPAGLAERLRQTPLLAKRSMARQSLYNIYFDTPEQALRQRRMALRLRRMGTQAKPQWVQTLKTGGSDASALSCRGEWESPVPGPVLSLQALKATPWPGMDPDGSLFEALAPCFVTVFERCSWQVHRRDGSWVEVALDIGHLEANGKQAPICELELELKAGQASVLFEIARELALAVAALPAHLSKAQRGFLLAQDGLGQPCRAQPPSLALKTAMPELAQCVLREMFAQFTRNLDALRSSDDPEVVHQARVGWRRFRSALRLFRKADSLASAPSWLALKPLLLSLGKLRNLDVATTATLPRLESGFCTGKPQQLASWQAASTALEQAAALERQAVRQALQAPSLGADLLAISEWLENLAVSGHTKPGHKSALRQWAKWRVLRLQQRLAKAQQAAVTPVQQHQLRILAKRLRYGVETLRDVLPKRLAALCHAQASRLQASLGDSRDMAQASTLVAMLDVDPAVAAYLRGVVVGLDVIKPSLD